LLINNYIQTVLNEITLDTSNKVWGHLELTIATGFTKKEKEEMKQEEISSDSGDLETIPVSFSFPLHLDDVVQLQICARIGIMATISKSNFSSLSQPRGHNAVNFPHIYREVLTIVLLSALKHQVSSLTVVKQI